MMQGYIKAIFAAILTAGAMASAQTVEPLLQPHQTFVDAFGAPCTGCLLYSYSAGTTSPIPTFTDSTGAFQNTNPIVLDAAGGAQIWVAISSSYKFVLQTAAGGSIWTVDNVTSPSGGGGGGGGMVYPPAGLGASTGAAWRTPTYADVIALWSGCSGGGAPYVLFNGNCGTGGATLASNTFIGTQTLISSGVAFTPLVVRQTTGSATPTFRNQLDNGGATVKFTGSHSLLAGSTIVIVVSQSDAGTTPALADTLSNVYTVAASTHLTGQGWLTILTAPNPNPGADTVSFSNTGSLASPYMVGYEITGLATSSLVDTTATVQGASSLASPQTSGSVTTSASDLVLTTLVAYGNGGLSASSSYTNLLPSGFTNTSVSAYAVLPSGTYTSSWTNNAAGASYSMITVALKTASSSTQTADLAQYQDPTGAVLARVDNVGGLHVPSCSGCGTLPVTITTAATFTAVTGFYYNQEATAGTAITYTLPTPAAGNQVCVKNSNNGSAANTGTLEILVANTGTQSIILNGTKSASGFVQSAGAAGDSACVVAISTTQWEAYTSVGVWTLH